MTTTNERIEAPALSEAGEQRESSWRPRNLQWGIIWVSFVCAALLWLHPLTLLAMTGDFVSQRGWGLPAFLVNNRIAIAWLLGLAGVLLVATVHDRPIPSVVYLQAGIFLMCAAIIGLLFAVVDVWARTQVPPQTERNSDRYQMHCFEVGTCVVLDTQTGATSVRNYATNPPPQVQPDKPPPHKYSRSKLPAKPQFPTIIVPQSESETRRPDER